MTSACGHEIKLGIASVESGGGGVHSGYCSPWVADPGR